ncbi:LuxR C-terminal-related transcriptional regulator [Epilithonimonas sp. UC225_85]|uniref:LuxR C-terminal-related transcriptional regulator n=1 Tax=Epilithonimonas sp. UC225_85 TaxID=3350167 RepID=UPI0036D2B1F3
MKNFTRYLSILLFVFVSFINAKGLDIDSLEQEIIKNNREGKHQASQKKLSEILLAGNLTEEEEANVLFLMAATYRSVDDYVMCIDYLNKSSAIVRNLPKTNLLRMKIDYEFAFVYFDNNEFEKSKKAMKHIADQNYTDVYPEDQSYILMQEGYLFLRDNNFKEAEKKYSEALSIMKQVSYCNLPVVMAKMMELYSRKNDIRQTEKIYSESNKISDSCGILKYKIFTASEMERLYKQHNMLDKAYKVGLKIDSLKKLEGQDVKISEMHIIDKEYLEKDKQIEENYSFWEKISALIIAIILLGIIIFSLYKSKKDKQKLEEEIEQIQEDLNYYSKNYNREEKFVNHEYHNSIDFDKLTERQKELIKLMTNGLSNKEIAEKLFITESTVKYHIKNIYSVLELKDRKDLFKKMNGN